MMTKLLKPRISVLAGACLLFGVIQVLACTVPVFRYALDRWHPDPYGIHVSEAWLETEAGKEFVKAVGELSHTLQIVPGEEKDGEAALLQPAPGSPELWRGKAEVDEIAKLLTSPARKSVVDGLVTGSSAVWVMVLSGDTKLDTEFEASLTKRLKYLEQVATIPPQDPFDPENKLGPGPKLAVGFSTVKVHRNDPAEALFIKMLAGQDGEELLQGKEPFAAPVFGRGRALGAWAAADLDDEGIDELSLFLLGACSCQVKAQNPGWDVLIDTDWDARLMKVAMALEAETMEVADVKPDAESDTDSVASAAPVEAKPEVMVFGKSDPEPSVAPATETAAAETSDQGSNFKGSWSVSVGVLLFCLFLWRRMSR